uniref:Prothymosin alpha a n=1 Tax=Astyanax mexicanus TaxID=7994 RepID=A0A8B9JZG7_ASTMX
MCCSDSSFTLNAAEMADTKVDTSSEISAKDLKEKKLVEEEAENGKDAPANGNADNEENGDPENEVEEEDDDVGEEEDEEDDGEGDDDEEDDEAEGGTGKRAAEDDDDEVSVCACQERVFEFSHLRLASLL